MHISRPLSVQVCVFACGGEGEVRAHITVNDSHVLPIFPLFNSLVLICLMNSVCVLLLWERKEIKSQWSGLGGVLKTTVTHEKFLWIFFWHRSFFKYPFVQQLEDFMMHWHELKVTAEMCHSRIPLWILTSLSRPQFEVLHQPKT